MPDGESSSRRSVMSTDRKTAQAAAEQRKLGLAETRRLEGFCDAAFSIIITLLVLEIHRPNAAAGRLGAELWVEWSSYLAYALAFMSGSSGSTITICSSV
jgi:hypothetical protein